MGDRCACGPRPKAVWESDDHEPEGEVPIGGKSDDPRFPRFQSQVGTGDGTRGDVEVTERRMGTGGDGIPIGGAMGSGGEGGAEVKCGAAAGGTLDMSHLGQPAVSKGEPPGIKHLAELASQLDLRPVVSRSSEHQLVMLSRDGHHYDVFELGVKLLEKLRELPRMPDVVRQLEYSEDECIRRQGKVDKADAKAERLVVQLAGCLTAAEGGIMEPQRAHKGDYGWSVAYQAVVDLRESHELLLQELERRRMTDGAVQVVDQAHQASHRRALSQGAKVVLAALDSQSGECRAYAERLIAKDDGWYAMVRLAAYDKQRACPSCEEGRAADCCNEECGGVWGTGCYHCHSAMFMDWKQAKALLLKRRDEKKRGGDDG